MIKTEDGIVIGGALNRLSVSGTVVIVSGEPNPPTPDGTTKINLRTEQLDPLVTFTGPGLRYLDSTGSLQKADENVWPLEYRGGKGLGRSGMYPESENLITALAVENMKAGADDGWLYLYTESGGNDFHRLRFETKATGLVTLQVFYRMVHRDYLCLRAATDTATSYKNIGLSADGQINYIGEGFSNTRVIDYGNGLYLLQTSFNCATGILGLLTSEEPVADDEVPRISKVDSSAGFYVGNPQMVAGELSVPPLAPGETLAASSAVIDTTNAETLTIYYSDNTSEQYDTPDDTFTLPAATTSWGDRWLTRIELKAKDGN